MSRLSRLLGLAVFAFAVAGAPLARAQTDQQTLVDRAATTMNDLRNDKAFGNSRELLQKARAIMIVPRLYKGGFFVGGEGGDGVLLARTANGWSYPAFYALGSASFGLQIGLQQSEMVMFVLTQKGLNALMQNQFKIGANAGIAVVTLGSSVEAATTSAVGADIVVWASSSGAYAGISLNGSVVKSRPEWNRAYYGRPLTTREVINGHVSNPGASALRSAVAGIR